MEDKVSIEVHVAVNSMKQRKLLPMNITIMYKLAPGGYAIEGINVAEDSPHERSYTIASTHSHSEYDYLSAYDSFTGLLNRDAFCSSSKV